MRASELFCTDINNYAMQQAGEHQDATLLPDCPPRQKSFTVGGMGQNDMTLALVQLLKERGKKKRPVAILFHDYCSPKADMRQ